MYEKRDLSSLKESREIKFKQLGMFIAVLSGICYGIYSAFLTKAMATGIWSEWYAADTKHFFSAFTLAILLPILANSLNDLCSAIWSLLLLVIRGKFLDFIRTLPTIPGVIMVGAALAGGPIAGVAYVIALQKAGSIVIPISALCPVIGTILGKFLFKQQINKHMWLGIFICLSASLCIGVTEVSNSGGSDALIGICIALVAAFGWGLEGCVAGYGTAMIDYEIGITMRQLTSGLTNLLILLPLAIKLDSISLNSPFSFLLGSALRDYSSIMLFVASGFFALFAFSLWYKGNSMCGAALGMACNGAYAFWGPFFCWLILGVMGGESGWNLHPLTWLGALLMVLGIFVIAQDPRTWFKREEYEA